MRRKESQIANLDEAASRQDGIAPIARTGRIIAVTDEGSVTVTIGGSQRPLRARLAIPASIDRIRRAIELRQQVLLLMEDGATDRVVIIGFIEETASPTPTTVSPTVVEADVDGKRVRLVAQDEIVLECGNASITLRRNGRVVIKGTYVETHSDGTNRIKGGQVRIN
jgi:hypothetical protein